MGFFRAAVTRHHQFDVIHLHRLTAIGLLDDRHQVGADLVPYREKVLAHGSRMLAAEDGGVGVVVDQRALRAPGQEHGLVGRQHHLHQRAHGRRPGLRGAEGRLRPVQAAKQVAGSAGCAEEWRWTAGDGVHSRSAAGCGASAADKRHDSPGCRASRRPHEACPTDRAGLAPAPAPPRRGGACSASRVGPDRPVDRSIGRSRVRQPRSDQHGHDAEPWTKKNGPRRPVLSLMLAEWTGLEPATPGVTGRYSNQLNYHSIRPAMRRAQSMPSNLPSELASPRGFEPL